MCVCVCNREEGKHSLTKVQGKTAVPGALKGVSWGQLLTFFSLNQPQAFKLVPTCVVSGFEGTCNFSLQNAQGAAGPIWPHNSTPGWPRRYFNWHYTV